LNPIPNLI